jgi:hypothetical protein
MPLARKIFAESLKDESSYRRTRPEALLMEPAGRPLKLWRTRRTRTAFAAVILAVAVMCPESLEAQRHGRPDAIQMYAQSIPAPDLRIEWASLRQRDNWRPGNLEAMQAQTLDLRPSSQSSRDVFTGVPLRNLLNTRGSVDPEAVLEVHYGFFRKKVLHWEQLDADETIVAERRNGKRVQDPWWLLGVDRHGRLVTIKSVYKIVVKSF